MYNQRAHAFCKVGGAGNNTQFQWSTVHSAVPLLEIRKKVEDGILTLPPYLMSGQIRVPRDE